MFTRVIKTVKDTTERLTEAEKIEFVPDLKGEEYALICLFPDVEYQVFDGIGGAFTEAAATTLYKMSEKNQEKILKAYFDEIDGIGYNYCRTHINSCDFSLGNYTYVDEGDQTLESFDISRDRQALIPMIKEAQKYADFKLFASPWSPPAYMKDSKTMNNGGSLLPEYYPLWAEYFSKYIEEYKKEGIDIFAVTVQNEPKAVQRWDSCIYTAEQERDFIKFHLGEKMKNLGVEIMFWDHNKERVYDRAKVMYDDEVANSYVSGITFHWYSGDHFEQLAITKEKYPDKKLVFSEGCQEHYLDIESNWHAGERYAHDMIGNFNNHCNAFIDWNMLLNETGGPNHVNNLCDAPIMADTVNDEVIFNPSYYYIGHMSKFIKLGAKRIGCSKYTDKLDVCAFENPNGELVVVALNREDVSMPLNLMLNGEIASGNIPARAIITFVIER